MALVSPALHFKFRSGQQVRAGRNNKKCFRKRFKKKLKQSVQAISILIRGKNVSSRPQRTNCGLLSPHQCRSKFMSPSFYIGTAANMKSNEPKSSAAAACPASARNTGGKERKGEREQDEGGREGERENKMRAIECRAKIHVGHSNSPTSLLPSSIFSCIFFISALFFCEKENLYFFAFLQVKSNKSMRSPRCCVDLHCPGAKASAAAAAAEQHIPLPLLQTHASNNCIQRRERDGTGLATSRPIRVKLHLKVKEVHILPVRSVFYLCCSSSSSLSPPLLLFLVCEECYNDLDSAPDAAAIVCAWCMPDSLNQLL